MSSIALKFVQEPSLEFVQITKIQIVQYTVHKH